MLSQLSRDMAEKMEEPLSQVRGWVNGIIEIAVARSYSQMIYGAWLPSPLQEQEPVWDPESGIGLAGKTACPDKNMYEAEDASKQPKDPPPPQPRTTRGNPRRNQGSTVFWHKKQGF